MDQAETLAWLALDWVIACEEMFKQVRAAWSEFCTVEDAYEHARAQLTAAELQHCTMLAMRVVAHQMVLFATQEHDTPGQLAAYAADPDLLPLNQHFDSGYRLPDGSYRQNDPPAIADFM
jgi:hypothetical protein